MLIATPLFAALLLPPAPPAPQGEGQRPPETPRSDPDAPRPTSEGELIGLSLEQALAIARRRDIGLQLQELLAEVRRHEYEGAFGTLDPVITSTAAYADSEVEAQSAFQVASVIEQEDWSVDTSLIYPLSTGGDLTLSYLLAETESNNELVQASDTATTDIVSLNFRQPLLRGAGRRYTLSEEREAGLFYRQELAGIRLAELDLEQSVADAYWDLVAARAQLEVALESLALSEAQLDQNQRRLEAGVGTGVEVLQSEADLATRREDLIEREMAVKDAADVLKLRLFPGTDVAYWSAEIEPLTELPAIRVDDVPSWQTAIAVALGNRPDLAQQRFAIEAAEEQLLRATSEQRAQLDFNVGSASRGFDRSRENAFEDALGWEFPTHTAAVTFSYPIGNRAAESAERAARAELRRARLAHDDLESRIVSEVRSSHRRVLYQAEAVVAAESSTALARRQLEAEEARFREGLATNFQVLEFQEDLTQAQFALVQARTGFAKARAALLRAQGLAVQGAETP
jgi:outer membrane protein TolC